MQEKGLKISRFFTQKDSTALESVDYEKRSCRITRTDGSLVFEKTDFEVPKDWTQNASDILISKYVRRAGVPQYDKNGKVMKDAEGNTILGSENSAKQVVGRLSSTWSPKTPKPL